MEGQILIEGEEVKWISEEMGLIQVEQEVREMEEKEEKKKRIYMVKELKGIGEKYWEEEERGEILGLKRGKGREEFEREEIERVEYKKLEIMEEMKGEWKGEKNKKVMRVDGGMVD